MITKARLMKELRSFFCLSFISFFFGFLTAGCDIGKPTTSNTQDSIDSKLTSLNIETKTVSAEDIQREYEGIANDIMTYFIVNEDESLITIKSTHHSFYVTAENDEGVEIKSKRINLHLMNPRHSSINILKAKKQYMD